MSLPPPDSLHTARRRAMPRLRLRDTPAASVAVHGAVLLLWAALFAMAFRVGGVLGWAVGVAYVLYDTALLAFTAWQLRALRWPAPPSPAAAGARCSVGVLVAARNESGALPLTLAALAAQSDPPDAVWLVDDGSTDGTAAWLAATHGLAQPAPGQASASAADWPALRWLRLPAAGKARALNAALGWATTDVVVTVDGDTLLEPGAIAALRQAFASEPALVAATGVIVPVCGSGITGRMLQWFQTYEYIRNFLSRYAWMRQDGLLLVSGAFAGYRLAALRAVGGFDSASMVEDYELTHRLRRHAAQQALPWTVRVLGSACARTDAPATIAAFLRQRRRWFGGFLQTQWRYRDMVGNRRYGAVGVLMLPVKAVDTLQPLYGLTAFFLLVHALATGRLGLLAAAGGVIGLKLAIDLVFHMAAIRIYRRWVGASGGAAQAGLGGGLLAALAEPFTFQLLRHLGAALGWVAFLTQRRVWGAGRRRGVVARR